MHIVHSSALSFQGGLAVVELGQLDIVTILPAMLDFRQSEPSPLIPLPFEAGPCRPSHPSF